MPHLPKTFVELLKIIERIVDDEGHNKRLKEEVLIHESPKTQGKK